MAVLVDCWRIAARGHGQPLFFTSFVVFPCVYACSHAASLYNLVPQPQWFKVHVRQLASHCKILAAFSCLLALLGMLCLLDASWPLSYYVYLVSFLDASVLYTSLVSIVLCHLVVSKAISKSTATTFSTVAMYIYPKQQN